MCGCGVASGPRGLGRDGPHDVCSCACAGCVDASAGFAPIAPEGIAAHGGFVHVADPAGVDRFDVSAGATLASFPAPAGVAITDVAVDTAGNVVAVGDIDESGDQNVWVGRFDTDGTVVWSDSFGGLDGSNGLDGSKQ